MQEIYFYYFNSCFYQIEEFWLISCLMLLQFLPFVYLCLLELRCPSILTVIFLLLLILLQQVMRKRLFVRLQYYRPRPMHDLDYLDMEMQPTHTSFPIQRQILIGANRGSAL